MREDTCVVCGHRLLNHIDEGEGWRCHSLGRDGYQCECFLRKDRAEGDIFFYSFERRVRKKLEKGAF